MKNINFARKRRQLAFRNKLLRSYLIALVSLLSFKEIKAQELPFAEPFIEPFNIFHNGNDDILDTFSSTYFFVDIDLDGDQDLFFVNETCPDYFYRRRGYYQRNELNETGKFSDTIPLTNSIETLSLFYPDYTGSLAKLVDIDNDGDLDKLITGTYYYGYNGSEHFFQYVPNLSTKRDSFSFDHFIGVGETCSSWQSPGADYNRCHSQSDFGDIDDDGDVDVMYLNSDYLFNYDDGNEINRTQNFLFFERNENNNDPLFEESQFIPFNLETIGNTLELDSNLILEIFVNDVNMDGQNDISVLSIDIEEESIPGILNYELKFKTFYKRSNNPVLYDENEHLIWTYKGQYIYDYEYYESTNSNAINYLKYSFLFKSDIYLVDLDNDGDQDIFMREVKNYYTGDYNDCDSRFNTQLYYFENQSVISGATEQIKANVEVYPNPTNGNIYIKTDSNFSNEARFELYNSSGALVFRTNYVKQNLSLKNKNLPSGIYYYKLYDSSLNLSGSIVFQ